MDTLHLPVAKRHRRRYSPSFKNKLIAACLQPGASKTAIAVANGINPNLVSKWIRLRHAAIDNPPSICNPAPALVTVRVVNPVTEPTATTIYAPNVIQAIQDEHEWLVQACALTLSCVRTPELVRLLRTVLLAMLSNELWPVV